MIEVVTIPTLAATALAGVVTVFLPCTYPMVIGYIALLIGEQKKTGVQLLQTMVVFFAGFITVYLFFGSIAGLFGQFSSTALALNSIKPLLATVGAFFFILLGCILIGVLQLPKQLRGIQTLPLPNERWGSGIRAFLIGTVFAAGWSPCIGPVLGGVLLLAGSSESIGVGALLLFIFALGMVLPFVVLTGIYIRAAEYITTIGSYTGVLQKGAGILFIILGTALLFNDFSFLGTVQPPDFLNRYI